MAENKDVAAMSGGVIEHGAQAPVAEDPDVVKGGPWGESQPQESPEAPLYKGLTGDIKSREEWVSYTKNLEEKLLKANEKPVAQVAPPPSATQVVNEKFEELLYTDPVKAKQALIAEIDAERRKEDEKRNNLIQFWNDFYSDNPDLKAADRVVQSIMSTRWNEIAPMQKMEAQKFLANESRKIVRGIVSSYGGKEVQLDSRTSGLLGASGEPSSRPTVPKEMPLSFVDQMRRLNSKRKK